MWCVAKLDEAYIERMEDVLKIYEKPLSGLAPVICLDESRSSCTPTRGLPGQ